MFQLSKVKICIFDVNGVLIDSNIANAHAMGPFENLAAWGQQAGLI
jgi:3-deoxy-D-manno-octulosonate 8-phosphate phosphatase KdsC-like HAD superfamily phosphatase